MCVCLNKCGCAKNVINFYCFVLLFHRGVTWKSFGVQPPLLPHHHCINKPASANSNYIVADNKSSQCHWKYYNATNSPSSCAALCHQRQHQQQLQQHTSNKQLQLIRSNNSLRNMRYETEKDLTSLSANVANWIVGFCKYFYLYTYICRFLCMDEYIKCACVWHIFLD